MINLAIITLIPFATVGSNTLIDKARLEFIKNNL